MTQKPTNCSPKTNQHVRFPHSAIIRAPGLLPMLYNTSELCEELDVPRHKVIFWINNGLPHSRDKRNHIWINGREFVTWMDGIRSSRRKRALLTRGSAYCLLCRKTVVIQNPETKPANGFVLITGHCPECGKRVNKGASVDKSKELQSHSRIS
jgi:hypothetical protein